MPGRGPRGLKGNPDSRGEVPPTPTLRPRPAPGCAEALRPLCALGGEGLTLCPAETGAQPAAGAGGGRGPAANGSKRRERLCLRRHRSSAPGMHTAPGVPRLQGAAPSGTQCVLCQPSSLSLRCASHCAICGKDKSLGKPIPFPKEASTSHLLITQRAEDQALLGTFISLW